MSGETNLLHILKLGMVIEGESTSFRIPNNIIVGEEVKFDSTHLFKKFFSELDIGLKIGSNVTMTMSSLATEPGGYIEIGDYSYLSNASIVAYKKIIIGKYVLISGGVTIVDSDFHPLDAAKRMLDTVAVSPIGNKFKRPHFDTLPVFIEDGVWIGFNATILKGVTIGHDSVIQPGAVVTKNVPPNSIVSGNPATFENFEHA